MSNNHICNVVVVIFTLAISAAAQLGDELDFGHGDVGLTGLSGSTDGQHHLLQQYNFPSEQATFGGLGSEGIEASGIGGSNIGTSGILGIPSTESITQLGQAIVEGGIPSGVHGEIATPTAQPPPQGQERRVGIAQRLISAGFLNRRR